MEGNLQKYIAFVKTVECGSFTSAAKALNYTQSGISRMIADLESEWKITLLERSRGGLRLTSDGTKMLPYARGLCEEYERLQMQVDELNGLQSGLIRIGTFSSVAQLWLPKIIKAFQAQYPNIDYEIIMGDYSEIESWILDGTIDCGFLPLPVAPELESIFIERNQMVVVMPKDHPFAGSNIEAFPILQLSNERLMVLEKGNGSEVTRILDAYNITPRVNLKTWDDYVIMAMIEQGLGISILTDQIMQCCPYDLVAKPLDVPTYRDVALVFRNRETSSVALRRFIEYLPYR